MSKEKQVIIKDLPTLTAPIKPELVEMEPKPSGSESAIPFKVLAHGGFGTIALGKMNGESCVVKIFVFDPADEKLAEQIKIFQNGMRNMLGVSSDRLVKPTSDYYSSYIYGGKDHKFGYFQVMPYIQGTDLSALLSAHSLATEYRQKFALQIAEGLRDMHEQKIVHGDFKLKNILIDGTGNAYICDFDFAIAQDKQQHSLHNSSALLDDMSPPEHWAAGKSGKAHTFTTATDIYKLGWALYSLHTNDLGDKIQEKLLSSDEMSNLIRKCLATDPKDRPSAAEVVSCLEKICSQTLEKPATSKKEEPEFLKAPGSEEEPKTAPKKEESSLLSCLPLSSCFSFFAPKKQQPVTPSSPVSTPTPS